VDLSSLIFLAQQRGGDTGLGGAVAVIGLLFLGLIALILVAAFASYGSMWLRAVLANCHVALLQIVGMKLRGVNPTVIVDSFIMARKSGINVDTNKLETHYLARGNVPNVIRAIIAASKAQISLSWEQACAIDLAGRDVLDAVKTSVNPRVIDCPNPEGGRLTIDAVAKDGIQLKARARVTVRTNLARLVGGATEETIIARVGQGIVSAIGISESFKVVLAEPTLISKKVLDMGLDAATAFEIVSIDIADIDVGENIGARLQADQAEANMRVAKANAEERRALAVAREQEMLAAVVENKAKVVLAEAGIPQAIAQAFKEGNLGIMDFYNLKNLQADTAMRSAIAGEGKKGEQAGQPS
jgi:uncharacterized protein YqfA (UPF0365 family)